jgi:predicted nucleic acid-binding protein
MLALRFVIDTNVLVATALKPEGLEGADAARADNLVTGNSKHFPPFWKNTKIITPPEFVSLAAPHLIR